MKAGGISVHVVDVANGRPALGLRVAIARLEPEPGRVAEGVVGPDGLIDHPVATGEGIVPGIYEVTFEVGAYFSGLSPGTPAGFLDRVPFRFTIAEAAEHFHLPLKVTPFGYALFRGL